MAKYLISFPAENHAVEARENFNMRPSIHAVAAEASGGRVVVGGAGSGPTPSIRSNA